MQSFKFIEDNQMKISTVLCDRAKNMLAAVVIVVLVNLAGCASYSSAYQNQKTFKSPEIAVESLLAAARDGNVTALEDILGPHAREVLSSGDPVADQGNREVFVVAMDSGWSLESKDSHTRELIVGHEQWPFPIPLVKDRHGWWFDTLAGKEEILARRIGRNELATISALRAYVVAQRMYASEGHDGKPAGIYAQRVQSSPGKHDGLYWPSTGDGSNPSPLSELAAQATAEGYSAADKSQPTPFHGYFYRILTRQGPDARDGAKDYVVNGEMTGGFAGLAFPAEYGNSGIMTFIVGADGVVYQADLGPDTLAAAGKIVEYNPDQSWRPAE